MIGILGENILNFKLIYENTGVFFSNLFFKNFHFKKSEISQKITHNTQNKTITTNLLLKTELQLTVKVRNTHIRCSIFYYSLFYFDENI